MKEMKEECTDCACAGCEYAERCRTDYPITHNMVKSMGKKSRKNCPIYCVYQLDSFQKELEDPEFEFLHE